MLDHHTFQDWMRKEGQPYRVAPGRRTLRFEEKGKGYFIKQHYGVGWKEILKNLLQGKLPVLGAKNEWLANQAVKKEGIPTINVLGYEERGWNPANRQSYLMSEELLDCQSLEDLVQDKKFDFSFKQRLIKEIALLTRTMHLAGINHRDYYLCHLWWSFKENRLYLMDLHRAQIRKKVPIRWCIKDVAGLYFSSMDAGLTSRDILKFLRIYFQKSLKDIFKQEKDFLSAVEKRANKLYIKSFFNDPECFFNQEAPVFLKKGDTSTVILVEARNKKFVIKRYNILHFFHWLKRAFRKSRAKKSWRGARLLMSADILTNKPIGFFEKTHFFGRLHSTSYFITEYLPGITLDEYFNKPISLEHKEQIMDRIVSMLKKMKDNNIVHGDMKSTNFLVQDEIPYLIDVDAVKRYKSKAIFNGKFEKDMKRFLKNWNNSVEIKNIISEKLNREKIYG